MSNKSPTLNCPNCGAPLKREAPYCEYCGTINCNCEVGYEVLEFLDGGKTIIPVTSSVSNYSICDSRDAIALYEELNCLF